MRLALVVVEEHTRRAMHLADNDALSTIDNERAVIGHQRHVAHVNGLFLDIADRLGAGILIEVPHDQPQHHLQRRRVRHAALDALIHIVFGFLELVIDELQPAAAGKVVDRKHRLEHFLQPGLGAAIRRHHHLQKTLIAGALHVDEVRHRHYFGDAPEALADPLASGK